jgi:hypothetical protein
MNNWGLVPLPKGTNPLPNPFFKKTKKIKEQ